MREITDSSETAHKLAVKGERLRKCMEEIYTCTARAINSDELLLAVSTINYELQALFWGEKEFLLLPSTNLNSPTAQKMNLEK